MRSRLITLLTIAGVVAACCRGRRGSRADTRLRRGRRRLAERARALRRRRHAPGKTFVKAVRVSDGKLLRWTNLRGMYGVPLVAYDGTAGGADARRQAAAARDRRDVDADALRRSLDAEPEGAAVLRAAGLVGLRRALAGRQDRLPDPGHGNRPAPLPRPRVRPLGAPARRGRDRRQAGAGGDDGLPGQPRRERGRGLGVHALHTPGRPAVHPRAEHARPRRPLHRPGLEGQPRRHQQRPPDAEPGRKAARRP